VCVCARVRACVRTCILRSRFSYSALNLLTIRQYNTPENTKVKQATNFFALVSPC